MTTETHSQMVSFIWDICNLLRGPYKRNEYRKVILPLTVLRRFDSILEPTKEKALAKYAKVSYKSDNIIKNNMQEVTGLPFYNISKLNFAKLLDDPNHIGPNLNSYINGFSQNVREIFERFDFADEVEKMTKKNLIYAVIKKFNAIDLSPERIDNLQMGYIFEELIRIGAEQANEEAGHHFTPREVIQLMVNLLLSPEDDLAQDYKVKTIYDPACGTGGMLTESERYIMSLNKNSNVHLFGQDYNDEAWATCKSDMLIKGEEADNIRLDNTFTHDRFKEETFDYMLANPPFGVSWDQEEKAVKDEADTLGYDGRFGAGLPRRNDGALLFLQHMISKMRASEGEGSRIGIVFSGSPLFTGDAGSGESNIRQWIIENDWLEAIIALPDQLFYNTGISTYVWIVTNRKEQHRKGKIQLIDARQFYVPMRKNLGQKRHQIGDGKDGRPNQIAEITKIYDNFRHNETRVFTIDGKEKEREVSKIFDNEDFGYHKVTVERPLRLNFIANEERIALLDVQNGFINLAKSKKKNEELRQQEIEAGKKRQQQIKGLLKELGKQTSEKTFKDRKAFLEELKNLDNELNVKLTATEQKAILAALGEQDETAEICYKSKNKPEPDPDLRDTEIIPLKEDIEEYFKREVLPHVPDAWMDESKTKVGYEIPLNRHFYKYEPPRKLEEIESEMKELEKEIMGMLKEVTNRKEVE
ncbi:MAG: type I restriction-modification system subunit M [Bacteroidales bacterium]